MTESREDRIARLKRELEEAESEATPDKNQVEKEQKRLKAAVRLARRQIRLVQSRAAAKSSTAGEELTYLLDAYLHMLQDSRLVRGAEQRIADQQINAEAAVKAEIVDIAQVFQAMDDSYIAARVDALYKSLTTR